MDISRIKSITRNYKKTLITIFIVLSFFLTVSFTQDYFEVSKNLEIFSSIFKELNSSYVDGIKPGQTIKTGIDAMLNSLDPYTVYYAENDIEDYRYLTTGEYGGIGTEVYDIDNKIIVKEPLEGFAAFKAGLRAGDQIVGVNDINVEGKQSDDIRTLLRGQGGTTVKLTLIKAGQNTKSEITFNREEIKPKVVPFYGIVPNSTVGYIKFTGFTTETCSNDVKKAYLSLKEQGCKSLVLDIRGNLGGFMREAINVVNFFIDKGHEVVFTKGKTQDWNKSYLSVNPPLDKEIPLVVLVDEMSASASEIVSGALQDLDRAVIVGKRTFGKGLVQETRSLAYNAKIKITVAKYYIPSGRCVQALDYSHRDDDGRVEKVPDSLIYAFKTKGGRIVYDGAGIMPDVITNNLNYTPLIIALNNQFTIFNYATKYYLSHKQISPASNFQLTDAEYDDFLNYLNEIKFEYKSKSELELEEIRRDATKENYYKDVKTEFENLVTKIKSSKKDDLIKQKADIKQALEEEIVSRYYFQSGRIEYTLKNDGDLTKAVELLKDENKFKQILTVINKPIKPFSINKKFQ
ncbi:MAG: S41 family peptidase [Bacteroidetes bacterium]|nr:S41 family peptidase [Bacteroidota bacterium]